MDALPLECQELVDAFARGWQPTPSARAMIAFWQQYPWVPEMQQLNLPGALLYRAADFAGLQPCDRCDCCYIQQLHNIRVKYEPEIIDDELDRLWSSPESADLACATKMDAFIQGALGRGIRPKRTANDALILRDGSKYRTLVDAYGQRTAAGRRYEALADASLPAEGYDAAQAPVRQGNAETIRCLLYTSPSPRDGLLSRMPSSA